MIIDWNWPAILICLAPFVLGIVAEYLLKFRYRNVLPSQFILHLGRISSIVQFTLAIIGLSLMGWINYAELFSFLGGNKTAILLTIVLGNVTWFATDYLNRRGLSGKRDKSYFPMQGKQLTSYIIVWMLFLFLYEVIIRGFLLPENPPFSIALLIMANAAIYGIVHLPRGLQEATGALLFGVVMGPVTLWINSIWPAFVAHAVLCFQMEILPTWRQNKVSLLNK